MSLERNFASLASPETSVQAVQTETEGDFATTGQPDDGSLNHEDTEFKLAESSIEALGSILQTEPVGSDLNGRPPRAEAMPQRYPEEIGTISGSADLSKVWNQVLVELDSAKVNQEALLNRIEREFEKRARQQLDMKIGTDTTLNAMTTFGLHMDQAMNFAKIPGLVAPEEKLNSIVRRLSGQGQDIQELSLQLSELPSEILAYQARLEQYVLALERGEDHNRSFLKYVGREAFLRA